MSKTRTFVDANVLIAALQGKDELWQKSIEILDDPDREFVVSDYLKLEVIPKPTFHGFHEEVQFMQTFIDNASIAGGSNTLDNRTSDALWHADTGLVPWTPCTRELRLNQMRIC